MQMYRNRFTVLLAALIVSWPVFGRTEMQNMNEPFAWLAIHSVHRLDQRLQDITTLAKIPGFYYLWLGMLRLQAADLAGLDRERPIGIVVPSLDYSREPHFAFVLPYTDKGEMLSNLRNFIQHTTTAADTLYFKTGQTPLFGRFVEDCNVLTISPAPQILRELNPYFPADIFRTSAAGPDIVFRMDVHMFRQQHRRQWEEFMAQLHKSLQRARKDLAGVAQSAGDSAFLAAYFALEERQLRRFLEDLAQIDIRGTFAGQGWVFEMETRMLPGSGTAALLNHQLGQTSQAAGLFSPEASVHFVYSVRIPDDLRKELSILLHLGRWAIQAKILTENDPSSAQPRAAAALIEGLFHFFDNWLGPAQLEIAFELHRQGRKTFELTGWIPLTESGQVLTELLDAAEKLIAREENAVRLNRNYMLHGNTQLHRLNAPFADVSEYSRFSLFLAAQDDFLIFHAGESPRKMMDLLDRMNHHTARQSVQSDTLVHFKLSLIELIKTIAEFENSADGSRTGLLADILRMESNTQEPLLIDLLVRENASVLRYVLPSSHIERWAAVLGRKVVQEMQNTLGE